MFSLPPKPMGRDYHLSFVGVPDDGAMPAPALAARVSREAESLAQLKVWLIVIVVIVCSEMGMKSRVV